LSFNPSHPLPSEFPRLPQFLSLRDVDLSANRRVVENEATTQHNTTQPNNNSTRALFYRTSSLGQVAHFSDSSTYSLSSSTGLSNLNGEENRSSDLRSFSALPGSDHAPLHSAVQYLLLTVLSSRHSLPRLQSLSLRIQPLENYLQIYLISSVPVVKRTSLGLGA
jgi:hypothetical protein